MLYQVQAEQKMKDGLHKRVSGWKGKWVLPFEKYMDCRQSGTFLLKCQGTSIEQRVQDRWGTTESFYQVIVRIHIVLGAQSPPAGQTGKESLQHAAVQVLLATYGQWCVKNGRRLAVLLNAGLRNLSSETYISVSSRWAAEVLASTLLGPLKMTRSRNQDVVVLTDCYRKVVRARQMASSTTKSAATIFIHSWVIPYGVKTYQMTNIRQSLYPKFLWSLSFWESSIWRQLPITQKLTVKWKF